MVLFCLIEQPNLFQILQCQGIKAVFFYVTTLTGQCKNIFICQQLISKRTMEQVSLPALLYCLFQKFRRFRETYMIQQQPFCFRNIVLHLGRSPDQLEAESRPLSPSWVSFQSMLSRSSLPITSMGCLASCSRLELKKVRPFLFSAIQRPAKLPS